MKINTKIGDKEIQITLTPDQIKEIARQTNSIKTIDDIVDLKSAETILKNCSSHTAWIRSEFPREKDWISYQLETIIKAANFIDNGGQEWIPDFTDSTYKYRVWFERKSSGWVFSVVYDYCSHSLVPVCFYYKDNKTAETISKRFTTLYNQWLG